MNPLSSFAAVCFVLSLASAGPVDELFRIALPGGAADQLQADGFDVLSVEPLELVVNADELEQLRHRGLSPEVLGVGRPFVEIQAERLSGEEAAVPAGYSDLSAIEAALFAAEASRPDICTVVDLTALYGASPTFEGRHLLAVKISDNVALDEDEPRVLLVSTHHAREIVTPVIALNAITQLLAGHGVDPDITAIVDGNEIWVAPVWNPDGYVEVFVGNNLWRKNRRVFPGAIGVDLNRNYPVGWEEGCGSSSSPSSSTYEGPESASEPETQTMMALSADRRFAKVIDFHSSGQEVRFGYGCWNHPLDTYFGLEATRLSAAMGYAGDIGSSCCLAGDIHLHTATTGSLAFLPETATEFQPSFASAQAEAAQVWSGILYFLNRPIPVTGHVTDLCSGLPLAADLTVVGLVLENGEVNGSDGSTGRFHSWLPGGPWTLRFSAPGYVTQDVSATVTNGSLQLDVALVPTGAGSWLNVGGGVAGALGLPALVGAGQPCSGQAVSVTMSGATPSAPATLVLGLSPVNVLFKGGVLVPSPDLLVSGLLTDGNGQLLIGGVWPSAVPLGSTLWLQYWVVDGSAPQGLAGSNGLQVDG
ncbi:MAG: putative deacylase [Pseudohongiellaceae bacterium]